MKTYFLFLLSIIFFASCTASNKISGSSNVTTTERQVTTFTSIENNSTFNVFIEYDHKHKLSIECDDNITQYIISTVENNTLKLNIKNNQQFKDLKKSNIYITVPLLSKIVNNGVGNLSVENIEKTESLELYNSGVGNVTMSGSVLNLHIHNSGVGDVNTLSLDADSVFIQNSGVGNIKLKANKTLSINSSGVGNIHYTGNAELKDVNSSGIGKIKKMD